MIALQRPSRARVLVAAVLVVVVGGATAIWLYAHREGTRLSALFTESVGVYPGSDVRVLGVKVGAVDAVRPQGTQVKVSMHLDPGVHVRPDTGAAIVSPNLVSDRYVQLTGVWTKGPRLRSGTTIPLARTHTPLELDDLYRSLTSLTTALGPKGANRDGALNRLLTTGAANLAGNGTALNKTVTQLSTVSTALNDSRADVFRSIGDLSSFTAMLKSNNAALAQVNGNLASVTQTIAGDRQTFGEALSSLATALSMVQTFVRDNRSALTTQVGKLSTVARTLAGQRNSIAQALRAAPLLVQNFVNTYDAKNNLLRGRINLNELTIWAKGAAHAAASSSTTPAVATRDAATIGTGSSSTGSRSTGSSSTGTRSTGTSSTGSSSTGSSSAPPALLPASNTAVGAGS